MDQIKRTLLGIAALTTSGCIVTELPPANTTAPDIFISVLDSSPARLIASTDSSTQLSSPCADLQTGLVRFIVSGKDSEIVIGVSASITHDDILNPTAVTPETSVAVVNTSSGSSIFQSVDSPSTPRDTMIMSFEVENAGASLTLETSATNVQPRSNNLSITLFDSASIACLN